MCTPSQSVWPSWNLSCKIHFSCVVLEVQVLWAEIILQSHLHTTIQKAPTSLSSHLTRNRPAPEGRHFWQRKLEEHMVLFACFNLLWHWQGRDEKNNLSERKPPKKNWPCNVGIFFFFRWGVTWGFDPPPGTKRGDQTSFYFNPLSINTSINSLLSLWNWCSSAIAAKKLIINNTKR